MKTFLMDNDTEETATFADNCRNLAEKYVQENSPGRAFLHYLLALELNIGWRNELIGTFSAVLCDWGKILEHEGRFDDLFSSYERALEIFPRSELILNNLGAHLSRLNEHAAALEYFKKALQANNDYFPAYRNVEIAKSFLVERWHFRMLNDVNRNRSYQQAIIKKINTGYETVLDIGSGTGILSVYAKQGGAKKVFACDCSETMVDIANKVLSANSMTESVVLINKLSTDLSIPEDIPERLSFVVTETFDGGLLGEHILETLIHAWDNLLLPAADGNGKTLERVIPKGATLYVTPVECLKVARQNYIIKPDRIERCSFQLGLNLSSLNIFSEKDEPYDTEFLKHTSYSFLAPPMTLFQFNFNDVHELKKYYNGDISQNLKFTLTKNGYIDAFAVWFAIILDDEIAITSSPLEQQRCCWEQAVFPIKEQRIMNEGAIISIKSICKEGILSIEADNIQSTHNELNKVSIPQSVLLFLNCESLLLTHLRVLDSVKDSLNKPVSVLDVSYFPYFTTLLAQCYDAVVLFSNPLQEIVKAAKNLLMCLNIDLNITYLSWYEMIMCAEKSNKQFDLMFIDILQSTGQINEEILVLLPRLRNLLSPGGLFIPSRLNICCKLVFSEALMYTSEMDRKKDDLKISDFINEYKVNQMMDFKIQEFECEEMSNDFIIAMLNLLTIENEVMHFEKDVQIIRSGYINAVLHWSYYCFTDDIDYSTYNEDSHIRHCGILLDSPLKVASNSVVKVILKYNSGVMKFHLATNSQIDMMDVQIY